MKQDVKARCPFCVRQVSKSDSEVCEACRQRFQRLAQTFRSATSGKSKDK